MAASARSVFVAEAREHLLDVCSGLLQLEQESESSLPQRVEPLQRALHSIKGGAGFFGLDSLEALAHRMEAVLSATVEGRILRDSRLTDVLLEATDRLGNLLDDPELGAERDLDGILKRLDELEPVTPSGRNTEPDSESGAKSSVLEIEFDLERLAVLGVDAQDLYERISTKARILRGEIATPAVDLRHEPPSPPYLWNVVVESSLDQEAFIRQLELPAANSNSPAGSRSFASTSPHEPDQRPSAESKSPSSTLPRASTIRIPIDLIDQLMSLAGELVLVRNQAKRYSVALQPLPGQVMQRLDAVTSAFQDTVLQTRMQPVATVFNKYPRLIRDLSRQLNKKIDLRIEGGEVELDKNILEALSDPLTHLIRNACDHGLESSAERLEKGKPATGTIELEARHLGDQILIRFADDGRGINRKAVRDKTLAQGLKTLEEIDRLDDRDLLSLILLPGFSTAQKVSDLSGRGVGMDVVKNNLSTIGGSIEIESEEGSGTTFLLRLPLTLAIIPTLLVVADGERYALPQKDIEELVYLDRTQSGAAIEWKTDGEVVRLRGALLPLVRLGKALKALPMSEDEPEIRAEVYAVVRAGSRRYGLVLDGILSNEEIVVKPLHPALKHLPMYSGATVLGDGRVALILNPEGIAQRARVHFHVDSTHRETPLSTANESSLSILKVRQTDGRILGIPLGDVLRIVMCQPESLEKIGDQLHTMIADKPTQILLSLENGPMPDSLPCAAPFFVILLRHPERQLGLAVQEVLGAEWIEPRAIYDIETGLGRFRTASLRGRLFQLAQFPGPDEEVVCASISGDDD